MTRGEAIMAAAEVIVEELAGRVSQAEVQKVKTVIRTEATKAGYPVDVAAAVFIGAFEAELTEVLEAIGRAQQELAKPKVIQ